MTNDSNPQPMNTERKVKTVRFNSHPAHFMAKMFNDGELIEVLDTQWAQGPEESAYVFFNDKQGRRHGAYAGFGSNRVLEIVELHQEPKNLFDQPQYATIADVERMIREAMGKREKVDEDLENQRAIFTKIVEEVRGLEELWRLHNKGQSEDYPASFDLLITAFLLEYTITKKNP